MDREFKDRVIAELRERVRTDRSPGEWLCKVLRDNVKTYNWVGIYVVKGDKLVLDCFAGEKTEHEQITIGDGLCSLAIVKDSTVNEPEVKKNSAYLACFPSTESEIVVPIRKNGKPVGEIDIDSDTRAAFSKEDEIFLSEIADILSVSLG